MATQGDSEKLSGRQIVRLAASIPAKDMRAIARDYMNISYLTIGTLWSDSRNSLAFNKQIIRHWIMRNPDNQVNVSNCTIHVLSTFCTTVTC